MAKLRLGALEDDKPIKVTVELPATVHRQLVAYADVLSRETGKPVSDPAKLIAPMVERFMATDRAFAKARRTSAGQAPRRGERAQSDEEPGASQA